MANNLVYWFREGGEEKRHLLGGKGAGLAEMTRIAVSYTHLDVYKRQV